MNNDQTTRQRRSALTGPSQRRESGEANTELKEQSLAAGDSALCPVDRVCTPAPAPIQAREQRQCERSALRSGRAASCSGTPTAAATRRGTERVQPKRILLREAGLEHLSSASPHTRSARARSKGNPRAAPLVEVDHLFHPRLTTGTKLSSQDGVQRSKCTLPRRIGRPVSYTHLTLPTIYSV